MASSSSSKVKIQQEEEGDKEIEKMPII